MTVTGATMATDSASGSTPRTKAKKKSTLSKLVERKNRLGSSVAADPDTGSKLSLRGNGAVPSVIPLEPEVIIQSKPSSHGCVPCRSVSSDSQLEKPAPRPRRSSRNKTAPAPTDQAPCLLPTDEIERMSEGEVAAERMSEGEAPTSSRSVPSDCTIYRFRNMRMAAEQADSAESRLQGPFVPKPPSTPRTPRSALPKGEKRNHEASWSGDEREVDPKRLTPGGSELESEDNRVMQLTANAGQAQHSRVQDTTGSEIETIDRRVKHAAGRDGETIDNRARDPSGSEIETIDNRVMKFAQVDLQSSPSHDRRATKTIMSSPTKSSSGDPANETLDQLHCQYQRLMDADSCKPSPLHVRHGSTASHSQVTHDSTASHSHVRHDSTGSHQFVRRGSTGSHTRESSSSTPRSGRLAPLEQRPTLPPPLGADVCSQALRTAYKSDPSYRPATSTMLGRLKQVMSSAAYNGMSSAGHLGSDTMSLSSASVMPAITTKEARSRSFLVGNVSSGSMSILGAEELERYFPDRRCHVFVGSWNMNENKSLSASLNDFILPETSGYVQDIYAIGSQENDMNRKEWEVLLQETLGPSHVLFHSVSFGTLHLAVFIRRDLIWFCSAPEEDVLSLRAVSMVKTKGAIGIAFTMFGSSFLFINCHLTADRTSSKNKIRLLDYHRVIRELRLPHPVPGKPPHPAMKLPDVTARFDSVFWCGDLNFRLERRRAAVEGKVSQMNDASNIPHFEELLGADQLSKFIIEGKIFEGFQEGRINFQPTYKFDVNSDKYDSSSKMRIPSYTDRILFRSRKKNQIVCLHYDAVMNIKISDHRAVYAFFEVCLRPGRDNIPLSAGQFDREVYLEANKRRAQMLTPKGQKSSSVCLLQ